MKNLQQHSERPDYITLNLYGGGSIQVKPEQLKDVVDKGKYCEVKLGVQRLRVIETAANLRSLQEHFAGGE